jgi:hypothetical protein
VGALIFYTFIYFIGYFSAHGFNTLMNRRLFNRRWAGLTGVCMVAILHAYRILNSTPPSGHDGNIMYDALGYYVVFPVGVITAVLLYLNWKDKNDSSSS